VANTYVAPPVVVRDSDHDGVPDPYDACPTLPGVASTILVTSGCPPPGYYDDGLSSRDRDGDLVLDAADACPDEPGTAEMNGCAAPPDKDGDGVADATDACPSDAGPPRDDPHTRGCPGAWVANDVVRILGGVGFASGSADLLHESEGVLDAVAGVLASRTELEKIRVEGHTDGRGGAIMNRRLSMKRAERVVAYLVAHGVAASRLDAAGFGADRPIDTNETEVGRATNRRVEFHVTSETQAAPISASATFADLEPAPPAAVPSAPSAPAWSPSPPAPAPAPTPLLPPPSSQIPGQGPGLPGTSSLDTPGL
jgi:outer membrane protein OmpA-like peptidoglycan-associated protein